VAFSPQDVEARRWLCERLSEVGLEAGTDCYGNVLGTWPGVQRAALIGSHTDTVPRGGWLDGALGVIYGLEAARVIREDRPDRSIGVDVISFQDEEGTYLPCLGSKSFCGLLQSGEIEAARSVSGEPLSDALGRAGFKGEPFRARPDRHIAFLEAHIEQGPRLISSGTRVGVVTSFVGIRRMTVSARGRADHAGTTPMTMRRDAAAPLFRFAAWVSEHFAAAGGPDTVWNIGKFAVEPGAANVVPSGAQLTLEFRDSDPDLLDRLEAAVYEHLQQLARETDISIEAQATARIPPARTTETVSDVIAVAARDNGCEPLLMQSGAGHDCMILGKSMPTGMMFIPSIGGRSHDIDEDTDERDIVFGCQVMVNAVERLLMT
jgi:N-carbamoyl-L-amino-acid hydrolase